MKHRFLLDENILHFAIKGINEQGQADATSTELIKRIGANCHTTVVNRFLIERYWRHVTSMRIEPGRTFALEPVTFIKQVLMNSEKLRWEVEDPPPIPAGVLVPAEDVEIVRLALVAHTRIVTGDQDLRNAVNASPALALEAVTPAQALPLAADS